MELREQPSAPKLLGVSARDRPRRGARPDIWQKSTPDRAARLDRGSDGRGHGPASSIQVLKKPQLIGHLAV